MEMRNHKKNVITKQTLAEIKFSYSSMDDQQGQY